MATNMLLAETPLGKASEAFFGALRKAAIYNTKMVSGAALILVREIKLELSHPGTGKWYGPHTVNGKRYKGHRASAPGEPPAVDTGVLRNTIDFEVQPDTQRIRVGSGQKYAPDLEFGTDRVLARPFMRTAFGRARKQMTDIIASDLKRATPK